MKQKLNPNQRTFAWIGFITLVIGAAVIGVCNLPGCSLISPGDTTAFCTTVQVVTAQRLVVESAASTVVMLHNSGQINDSVYAQAQTAYARWAQGEKAVVDSLVAWNDAGAGTSNVNVPAMMLDLMTLYADFTSIYNSFAVSKIDAAKRLSASPVTAATCTETTAQLQALYADAWPANPIPAPPPIPVPTPTP